MIGKMFRSLPFIFANNNYTLSKVPERARLKQSVSWLVPILFPNPGHSRNNYRMGTMILAEIDNFPHFDSPDKILAYAGVSPSTYQSRQSESSYSYGKPRITLSAFCPNQCCQVCLPLE